MRLDATKADAGPPRLETIKRRSHRRDTSQHVPSQDFLSPGSNRWILGGSGCHRLALAKPGGRFANRRGAVDQTDDRCAPETHLHGHQSVGPNQTVRLGPLQVDIVRPSSVPGSALNRREAPSRIPETAGFAQHARDRSLGLTVVRRSAHIVRDCPYCCGPGQGRIQPSFPSLVRGQLTRRGRWWG